MARVSFARGAFSADCLQTHPRYMQVNNGHAALIKSRIRTVSGSILDIFITARGALLKGRQLHRTGTSREELTLDGGWPPTVSTL
jgi:hypothetical protein